MRPTGAKRPSSFSSDLSAFRMRDRLEISNIEELLPSSWSVSGLVQESNKNIKKSEIEAFDVIIYLL